jgi:hemerythrin superfamily protein
MASPSIISLLKKDHKEVSALLDKAVESRDSATEKRTRLFEEINQALTQHTRFEEESIYPILTAKRSTKDDTLEAIEEHAQVKHLLQDIGSTDVGDERWKAKMMVLSEDVRHHVKEEESRGGLFDELKRAASESQLAELAEEFQQVKDRREAAMS